MTTKKPVVVRVDAVVRAIKRTRSRFIVHGCTCYACEQRRAAYDNAIAAVERLARPAQRKGKR